VRFSSQTLENVADQTSCSFPLDVAWDDVGGRLIAACGNSGVTSYVQLPASSGGGWNASELASRDECYGPVAVTGDFARGVIFAACMTGVARIDDTGVHLLLSSEQYGSPNALVFVEAEQQLLVGTTQGVMGINLNNGNVTRLVPQQQCNGARSLLLDQGVLYVGCTNGVLSVRSMDDTVVFNLSLGPPLPALNGQLHLGLLRPAHSIRILLDPLPPVHNVSNRFQP
jgi:hypothetical protein